ncbi:hypothetical protein ACJ5NV_07595 [Loktanella agnita]|uniref:hypothetical protein n=1 Tax=Loktanella agnita TaxID=287097 RepID=UPI00398828FD
MKQSKDMAGLIQISELQYRTAQADMARIRTREEDLRRKLAQLIESKSAQAIATQRSDAAALIAGADIRWHRWVDQRRAAINAELAQVLALKENSRVRLQNAFGRDRAMQKLSEQMLKSQKAKHTRRQSYES